MMMKLFRPCFMKEICKLRETNRPLHNAQKLNLKTPQVNQLLLIHVVLRTSVRNSGIH